MDVEKFIGYYEHVWDSDLYCDGIRETNYDYQPSSYSDHVGKVKADKRVRMDEVWVRFGDKGYDEIKKAVEYTCRLYSEEDGEASQPSYLLLECLAMLDGENGVDGWIG